MGRPTSVVGALRVAASLRLLFGLAAAVLLAACTPGEPAEGALLTASGAAVYTDGTYFASFSHTGGDGWQPFLQIRVRGGLITEVCFAAVRADGTRARDDADFVERMRIRTGVDLTKLMADLQARFAAAQNLNFAIPASRMDDAVGWLSSFVVLADAVLALAREGGPATVVIPAAGPYRGTDRPDELGWQAHMVIAYGERGVAAAMFEEQRLDANGTVRVKANDAATVEAYSRVTGLTPAGIADSLTRQLVERGAEVPDGLVTVDAVSGATGTSGRFQMLANRISEQRISVPLPNNPCK